MADKLTFQPGFRQRTNGNYDDYFVNGQRLADTLRIGDFIPPFGWLDKAVESRFAEMLLRKTPSDLRKGRVPLFVCPECVDYGCGVGTCMIDREGDLIAWRDFGWETDYEDDLIQDNRDRDLVLQFDCHAYWQTLSRYLTSSEQDGTGQPATRPESDSEGSDKPQPESEGRSR
ncbi:hypothetical protein BH23VER1_BH23VER1_27440 [soil metagenome]